MADGDRDSAFTGYSSRPVPDPTQLTTDALLREISGLEKLIQARINTLEEVTDEKFLSIDQQLDLVERQRVEQKQDTKAAVDAALTAQKEAVKEQTTASERAIAKSEASTTKQLEQLGENFTTAIKAVTDAQTDIKDRVVAMESLKQGGREQRAEARNSAAGLYALIATIVGVGGLILAVVIATH